MRAAEIEKLVSVGRPDLSPDGTFAVFATSRPDLVANRNVGQIWRIDLPTVGSGESSAAPLRRLTQGVADSAPALSPDGLRLAFLRADGNARSQVNVIPAVGGEPVQVTDAPLGVQNFAWSPDGESLAYLARVPAPGRYGTVDGLDAAAEAPRRITGVRWNANGVGYITDRPVQLFAIAVPSADAEPIYASASSIGDDRSASLIVAATARALTTGSHSHSALAFTAEGDEILTIVDAIEQDARDLRTPLIAVALDGSGEREVLGLDANLAIDDIAVAEDGMLAVLATDVGADGIDFVGVSAALWLLEAAGPRALTDSADTDLGEVGSHITSIGADFLVQDRRRGRVRLLRVTRGGVVNEVLAGDVEVGGHAAAGDRIIASVATPRTFGEAVLIENGTALTVSAFADALVRAGLTAPMELTVAGRDGYPIHGWTAVPPGPGPHPVILQIHGGPYASYGIHPSDETQVLVDAGYAVVYCNPRGSAGYGRAHGRSIRHAMGTVDAADVLDFFDGALAGDPRLDRARIGIMGGSYGGYLTAWIIAHTHRFAAAIVERGFLDPLSFQGTSDIGSFFGDEYVGTDPVAIAAQSPMAVVSDVVTPTIVIHSELDFRCPLEQATRYYSALKRQGTEAELLVFPGESHELTRSGQPRHRLQRLDAVVDWWRRHLPTA